MERVVFCQGNAVFPGQPGSVREQCGRPKDDRQIFQEIHSRGREGVVEPNQVPGPYRREGTCPGCSNLGGANLPNFR